MTAPFPTHKQEEWRYADLDALKPVWEQFAEPVTLTVGAGESFEEVWLPVSSDVQLRRVQLSLGAHAKARIFALNSAAVYGRIELEVSLQEGAQFELFAANIGMGLSTNEVVTNVKHVGVGGRSRQVVRSVLNGQAAGSYLGKVEVARGAQKTDAEQSPTTSNAHTARASARSTPTSSSTSKAAGWIPRAPARCCSKASS